MGLGRRRLARRNAPGTLPGAHGIGKRRLNVPCPAPTEKILSSSSSVPAAH
jgi:hypothetical protein